MKKDVIAELLDADHAMNYRTGKFESLDETVVAEDTYAVIETETNEIVIPDDVQDKEEEISEDELEYLEDEELVKENIKRVISDGMELLEDLYENVRITEQPKSFEYAALFMKTMVEMNQSLLDVHDRKKKRNTVKQSKEASGNTISQVNNNIHIHDAKPTSLLKRLKLKG